MLDKFSDTFLKKDEETLHKLDLCTMTIDGVEDWQLDMSADVIPIPLQGSLKLSVDGRISSERSCAILIESGP